MELFVCRWFFRFDNVSIHVVVCTFIDLTIIAIVTDTVRS